MGDLVNSVGLHCFAMPLLMKASCISFFRQYVIIIFGGIIAKYLVGCDISHRLRVNR